MEREKRGFFGYMNAPVYATTQEQTIGMARIQFTGTEERFNAAITAYAIICRGSAQKAIEGAVAVFRDQLSRVLLNRDELTSADIIHRLCGSDGPVKALEILSDDGAKLGIPAMAGVWWTDRVAVSQRTKLLTNVVARVMVCLRIPVWEIVPCSMKGRNPLLLQCLELDIDVSAPLPS